jgi:hypothetical protein
MGLSIIQYTNFSCPQSRVRREYSVAAKISEYEANQSEYFIIFPSERIFSEKIKHVRSSEMGKETYCVEELRDNWCRADNTVPGWTYEAWSLEMAMC